MLASRVGACGAQGQEQPRSQAMRRLVEDAFEQKLSEISQPAVSGTDAGASPVPKRPQSTTPAPGRRSRQRSQSTGIDKSVLAIAAPRRYRNREHLRFVAQQPCLVCGRKPSDPHHLRFMQPRALGRKASDEFAVPLCQIHHRLVHRVGNEAAWWKDAGIDPVKAARKFWKRTRLMEEPAQGAKEAVDFNPASGPNDNERL